MDDDGAEGVRMDGLVHSMALLRTTVSERLADFATELDRFSGLHKRELDDQRVLLTRGLGALEEAVADLARRFDQEVGRGPAPPAPVQAEVLAALERTAAALDGLRRRLAVRARVEVAKLEPPAVAALAGELARHLAPPAAPAPPEAVPAKARKAAKTQVAPRSRKQPGPLQ